MTRTVTNRRGKSYSYCSWAVANRRAERQQRAAHSRRRAERYRPSQSQAAMLTPGRLGSMLQILIALQRNVIDTGERLRRLHRSIEEEIVELDDILRERHGNPSPTSSTGSAASMPSSKKPGSATESRS